MENVELLAMPATLGDLKRTGYRPLSIRAEIRKNLEKAIKNGEPLFDGIIGYDQTVLPDLTRALLSGHHINLLGLRGQAKTRLARSLVQLLDEYIPVLVGTPLNEDPLLPISDEGKKIIEEMGEEAPISWLHRHDRFAEKLATPDVSVADLIGDVDPIKAAHQKLSLGDFRAVHFGLIPRSNRCIFVLNEIPDLQARIQVALFNLLQEGDFQVRGFHYRLPIDSLFVFTANPEDYTQRGSMVTPLKDRIGSQILTHYPQTIDIGKQITRQEIRIAEHTKDVVHMPELLFDLVEQVAVEARHSEFVDAKSGVSARLTISAMEHIYAAAEYRAWKTGESKVMARMADLFAILPAVNGKIELVYEGEQEGAGVVARNLIGLAIRNHFTRCFGHVRKKLSPELGEVVQWFSENEGLKLPNINSEAEYHMALNRVDGLNKVASAIDLENKNEIFLWMEFILHGLAEHSKIGRKEDGNGQMSFGDLLGGILNQQEHDEE